MMKRTLVIAEAGVNHNGSIALAKQLIDVAIEAGADLVKFQTFSADRQVTRGAKKADYQKEIASPEESQYEMLKRLELTESMHHELLAYCKEGKIGFISTGFDIESINFLASIKQSIFKIPSGEINNPSYLRKIGSLKKEVILSTGMSTLAEIESAIDILENAGTVRNLITVLHCTSQYPAPINEVNLRAMLTIRDAFGVNVGYSDHTEGTEVSIAAVAMGASVIEKHFTINRGLPGPDHKSSLEPSELKAMIKAIRNIELALGDGIKRPTFGEINNMQVVRKSIVARCDIVKGERFSEDNITLKRPGTGISPMKWGEVLGRCASRNFKEDELIEI